MLCQRVAFSFWPMRLLLKWVWLPSPWGVSVFAAWVLLWCTPYAALQYKTVCQQSWFYCLYGCTMCRRFLLVTFLWCGILSLFMLWIWESKSYEWSIFFCVFFLVVHVYGNKWERNGIWVRVLLNLHFFVHTKLVLGHWHWFLFRKSFACRMFKPSSTFYLFLFLHGNCLTHYHSRHLCLRLLNVFVLPFFC